MWTVDTVEFAIAGLSEVIETSRPFGPAALEEVTVPTAPAPPDTVEGLIERAMSTPVTVSVVDFVSVADLDAVIVTVFVAGMTAVLTSTEAARAPAGTTSEACGSTTVPSFGFSDRLTSTPLAGAGAVRVTVTVAESPPLTVLGSTVIDPMLAVTTWKVAETVLRV